MRTSGLFTTHTYTIPFDSLTQTAHLVIFSDVHFGNPGFSHRAWGDLEQWGQGQPRAFYLGVGDYFEWYRAHTRKLLLDGMDSEEHKSVDEFLRQKMEAFIPSMEFMRGRIIGLGDGNHGWIFEDGRCDTELLAEEFNTKFLGVSSVIRIVCDYHGSQVPFLVYMWHGKAGGGSTVGATFNAVERMGKHVEGVTIFVQGDDHKRGIVPGPTKMRFVMDGKSGELVPREFPQFFCRSGSFVKSYEPRMRNYVIDSGLGPTSLGSIKFKITLRRSPLEGLTFHLEGIV